MKKEDVIVKIIANMAYGYNGSDPKKPKFDKKGLKYAVATFKEFSKDSKGSMKKEVENIKIIEAPDDIEELSSKSFAFGAGQMNMLIRIKKLIKKL